MKEVQIKCSFKIIFLFITTLILIFFNHVNLLALNIEKLYMRSYDNIYHKKNANIYLDIECHSGTPPILEFVLNDTEKIVKDVSFDFDHDGIIDLNIDNIKSDVIFRGTPYRKNGVYIVTVFLNTSYGTFMREFNISFTDFVWGKNNFNFANDGKFENRIDFVSKTIIQWAEERFEELNKEQKVILLYIMYNLYKGSIGRCYGFSGGEAYFIKYPTLIIQPYNYSYLIPENDPKIIKFMDFMQNDIVFSNFISGKINLLKDQTKNDISIELITIKESIDYGKLIVIGYISRKMHHSMVIYGYFENKFRNKITLLTANNWERKQENNYFSEDAENIVVQFKKSSYSISWYDLTKRRYRYPDKIFAVQINNKYNIFKKEFLSLLTKTKNDLINNNKTIIMIEKTEVAYIEDENGKRTGYIKPDSINEINNVSFKKIDYNYVFEVPVGINYNLVMKKGRYNKDKKSYEDINIFVIIPQTKELKTYIFNNISIEKNSEKIFKISKDITVEK